MRASALPTTCCLTLKPCKAGTALDRLRGHALSSSSSAKARGSCRPGRPMAKEVTDFKGQPVEAFALRGRATGVKAISAVRRWRTAGAVCVPRGNASQRSAWRRSWNSRATLLPEENWNSVANQAHLLARRTSRNSWERSEIAWQVPKVLPPGVLQRRLRLPAATRERDSDPDWEKKSAPYQAPCVAATRPTPPNFGRLAESGSANSSSTG